MKTALNHSLRAGRTESGSAVLIILILLSIMLVLSQSNTIALNRLNREIKTREQQQIQQLAALSNHSATNGVPAK